MIISIVYIECPSGCKLCSVDGYGEAVCDAGECLSNYVEMSGGNCVGWYIYLILSLVVGVLIKQGVIVIM